MGSGEWSPVNAICELDRRLRALEKKVGGCTACEPPKKTKGEEILLKVAPVWFIATDEFGETVAAIDKAIAEEREACAKLTQDAFVNYKFWHRDDLRDMLLLSIRSRK